MPITPRVYRAGHNLEVFTPTKNALVVAVSGMSSTIVFLSLYSTSDGASMPFFKNLAPQITESKSLEHVDSAFCLERDHPTMLLFLAETVVLEPDEKASGVLTSAERRTRARVKSLAWKNVYTTSTAESRGGQPSSDPSKSGIRTAGASISSTSPGTTRSSAGSAATTAGRHSIPRTNEICYQY